MERRKSERREFCTAPDFPLITRTGQIEKDRRRQPDRRLNSIEVTYMDFNVGALQAG